MFDENYDEIQRESFAVTPAAGEWISSQLELDNYHNLTESQHIVRVRVLPRFI